MDISVSRLNERMAVQLPAQFPLGLVFVVGTVKTIPNRDNGKGAYSFFLIEKDHRLRCQLSARAARSLSLEDGSEIRAGGHLAFDPRQADYFLLARDVELVHREPPRTSTLAAIIQDYNLRSEAAGLVPAELPEWVRRMAPPEIHEEWHETISHPRVTVSQTPPRPEPAPLPEPRAGQLGLGHEVAIAGLSDELLDFLSEAMDSDDDVELTPELVAEFTPSSTTGNGWDFSSQNGAPPEQSFESDERPSAESSDEEKEASSSRKFKVPWIPILVVLIVLLLATSAVIFGYLFL